jgi:hypothetical protein
MTSKIKFLLGTSVSALLMMSAGIAGAQETPAPETEEEAVDGGNAVSAQANTLSTLDPAETEGPGLSEAAQELRAVALANLPEEAAKGQETAANAGRPETVGKPENVGRPETAERPDMPDRAARPDRPERPERATRPERPDRPGRPG